jgi:hypothetical protein
MTNDPNGAAGAGDASDAAVDEASTGMSPARATEPASDPIAIQRQHEIAAVREQRAE